MKSKGVEIDPSTTDPNYLESEGIEHPSESKPLEFEGDKTITGDRIMKTHQHLYALVQSEYISANETRREIAIEDGLIAIVQGNTVTDLQTLELFSFDYESDIELDAGAANPYRFTLLPRDFDVCIISVKPLPIYETELAWKAAVDEGALNDAIEDITFAQATLDFMRNAKPLSSTMLLAQFDYELDCVDWECDSELVFNGFVTRFGVQDA